jgi:hypothetical protein
MRIQKKLSNISAIIILVSLLTAQIPAFACASCGCSEVCPLTAMDANSPQQNASLLSNSIWGNIILKMAYARDPQVLALAKKIKRTGLGSASALAGVAAGTISQGIVAMAVLNPPEGIQDSYAPGSLGLGLEAAVLMIFAGGPLISHRYKQKLKARQIEIRQNVERILQHLEYSKTDCSAAQKELADLVGDRGAQECVQLWQSSHRLAMTEPPKISAVDNTEKAK